MATFWDHVEIGVQAGDGGSGLISFRREWGEAKGGPDGGDGGSGGSVVLVADSGVNTLAEFGRKKRHAAKNGTAGGKGKRHGKSADDLLLHVPVGTVAREGREGKGGESGRILADLTEPGEQAVIARGGRGGFGNAHFTSSRRQAPRQAEKGEPGEERELELELKLVADVGLIGIPSVGKSTFLRSVSAARPKVADYPFTTTVPQLGIAQSGGDRLTVADIPGLIEGAHQGKGLGDAFLRHVERTKVLIHLLDATREDPAADYRAIRHELASYAATSAKSLPRKPELIALNKSDTLPEAEAKRLAEDLSKRIKRPVHPVSAAAGKGISGLLNEAAKVAKRQRNAGTKTKAVPRLTLSELAPGAIAVQPGPKGTFEVRGSRLERLAKQTDFENPEAAERFWWTARRHGLDDRLEKLGAEADAPLRIAGVELTWPGPTGPA
ncbi:MAG: GTPase ObgE [bacterium]|nr:GTPase ObgE [bacterium]MDZ4247968.1 GTPase ObgE [Patescibacteria group bacterium]